VSPILSNSVKDVCLEQCEQCECRAQLLCTRNTLHRIHCSYHRLTLHRISFSLILHHTTSYHTISPLLYLHSSSLLSPSGMSGKVNDEDMFRLEKRIKKAEAIIACMTEEERTVPDLIARQVLTTYSIVTSDI
jgi:hypothetical protein